MTHEVNLGAGNASGMFFTRLPARLCLLPLWPNWLKRGKKSVTFPMLASLGIMAAMPRL